MDWDRLEKLQRLARDARGLPEDQRGHFLDGVCGDDDQLRAQVLRMLLDEPSEVRRERVGRDLRDRLALVWSCSGFEDRYRVLHSLSEGGLGTVAVAEDLLLGRRVALKTIHPKHGTALGQLDPVLVHRFLDEAEIAAQLLHPGIPWVHDLGIGPGGVPYYTMRLIRGTTFGETIRARRNDTGRRDRLLRMLVDVATTLDYAHGRGVLHRDVKPANVMIGRFGEVCVLDWGLAKSLGERLDVPIAADIRTSRRIDLMSQGPGSPSYRAPEQAFGIYLPANDVFSVGAILHEILVGAPPRIPLDAVDHELPAEFVASQPELAAVCARAIAPDPARRYRSAREFADDLRAFLEHRPVSAHRETLACRCARWWVRLRRCRSHAPRASESGHPHAPDAALGTVDGGAVVARLAGRSSPPARYELEDLCGVVGMSEVWRAVDRLLGRRVAVKRMRASLGDEFGWRERLAGEALIAGRLDHPAVLTAHELGIDQEGRLRIVMPLITGPSLAQLLAGRSDLLGWRPLVEILVRASRGLAHAHASGIVHRDVKPSNILTDAFGGVYLFDWGLAAFRADGQAICGTPLYMSPEACTPGIEPPQRASDVYSIGCVLYEIVTGTPPFMGVRMKDLLAAKCTETPEPCRARNPRVPRALASVCDRAIARDPRARHADAGVFVEALVEALDRA